MAYSIAHLDEIQEHAYRECRLRAVRQQLGITAFGVNAWAAEGPGDRLIPEHDESDGSSPEELYVVLRGRAVFELDGERRDAPAGTLVFVAPGVKRTAFAEEAGTAILAVGATPGRPYVAAGWEVWAEAYDAGRYEEAADRARELLDDHPDYATQPRYATLVYNVACFESLAGRRADAVEHLQQAVAMSDDLRELAKSDSDLDPIRDEPAVKQLVG
jgi:hypothetical protein